MKESLIPSGLRNHKTEDEARRCLCPLIQKADDPICVGAQCMAWRWLPANVQPRAPVLEACNGHRPPPMPEDGVEGIWFADAVGTLGYVIDEYEPQAARNGDNPTRFTYQWYRTGEAPPPRGYCGLVRE